MSAGAPAAAGPTVPSSSSDLAARARGTAIVFAVALVVRVAVFPFADNKHGDAPMRALIAQRLTLDAAAAAEPRAYCQFGPLHMLLMSPFIELDADVARSSRYLSLLAGLLTFVPFLRLARRLSGPLGEGPATLAGLALAASPLHIQASTTAASEALYLLLFVSMLERLTSALEDDAAPPGRFLAAGALASLAAVTRYDAWVALPAVLAAAWLWGRGPAGPGRARRGRGLALFAAAAAVLPAAWTVWSGLRTDDPIFFFHYISSDHAHLGATVLARYGPALARLRQLAIWALAFVAAMTPVLAYAAVAAVVVRGRRPRLPPAARVVVCAALAPVTLYLAQGLARLSFEPLPRFALVPGTLLLPLAAAAVPLARLRAARLCTPLAGLLFAGIVWGLSTVGRPRIWGGAESNGALTRLDGEDRAVARYLAAHRAPGERVMIEPFGFSEIAVTEAAGIPETESMSIVLAREPAATVAETMRATGARWLVAYDDDRPRRWTRRLPDWPPGAVEVGRWRLIHR